MRIFVEYMSNLLFKTFCIDKKIGEPELLLIIVDNSMYP